MRVREIMFTSGARRKSRVWQAIALAVVLAAPTIFVQASFAQGAAVSPFTQAPLVGRVSSGYGEVRDPTTGSVRFHGGVDIVGEAGANVVSPAGGVVLRAIPGHEGYGNFVEINHGGGLVTRYGHLQSFDVRRGQRISAGQVIARVGATGNANNTPHLYVEVLRDGVRIDPASVFALQGG